MCKGSLDSLPRRATVGTQCIFLPTRNIKFFPKRLIPAVLKKSHQFLPCSQLILCILILPVILDPSLSVSFSCFCSLSPFLPRILSSLHSVTDKETEIPMAEFSSWGGREREPQRFCRLFNTDIITSSSMVRHHQFSNPYSILFQAALASWIAEWHLKVTSWIRVSGSMWNALRTKLLFWESAPIMF